MNINSGPGFDRTLHPDMALQHIPGPDITMAPGSSTDHSDQNGPRVSMALGHQQGLRWLTKPQASSLPSVVTKAMYNNTDPSCYKATDTDMTLCTSLAPDVIMALGGIKDTTDKHDLSGSMTLRH